MSIERQRLPVLDGLRFIAALTVMLAHFSFWVLAELGVHSHIIGTLSGLGMPLFFVLSGFVIHYNYHRIYEKLGGVKEYLIARFTRLYPLYIVLFTIEFVFTIRFKRGSCGHAGDRWALLMALPYYLTLTQDWIFGVIGQNNLIYQYQMVGAVSWSISLEFFFYVSYFLIVLWLAKQKSFLIQLFVFVLTHLIVIAYLTSCWRHSAQIDHAALIGFGTVATEQHGYQDSFMRWLYYFNPLVNLPAFFMGTLIANIYLKVKDRPLSSLEKRFAGWFTFGSISAVLAIHYFFYIILAPTNGFIGRTASVLDAPLIAIMLYCLVRYSSTLWNKCLSWSLLVKLGESSYSIYLFHAFFASYPRKFYHLNLNPWVLYTLTIVCILALSRLSYILFERPVQRFLRRKLLKQKIPLDISADTKI
jgi:peptidoglycan/LPS O-acetylase OafA/YrhL